MKNNLKQTSVKISSFDDIFSSDNLSIKTENNKDIINKIETIKQLLSDLQNELKKIIFILYKIK